MYFTLTLPLTEASVSITKSDQLILPNLRFESIIGEKNFPLSKRI